MTNFCSSRSASGEIIKKRKSYLKSSKIPFSQPKNQTLMNGKVFHRKIRVIMKITSMNGKKVT